MLEQTKYCIEETIKNSTFLLYYYTAKYIQQLCSNVIDFTRLLLPIPAPLPANIRCVCAIPGDKDYWHGYLYS